MSGPIRLAGDLSLPAEAVTETFAILAKRGMGKTYTASVLAEEMLKAGQHVVAIDPVGVWWGLRASADASGPGLPIAVLGGEHGDVPLEVTAGQLIADVIIDEGLSAVLDLSLFRKGESVRFLTDFAERLYHRNRQPLHLIMDEADAYAPQKPMRGYERLLGAIEDIVRRGRARGLGATLVTQRAAVLNKDVLTQCEVLVALRTIAPQDRSAIDDWVRVHGTPEQRDELMASLPSLPIGTAWFWSPGWLDIFQRVQVRQRETFDSSATPKVGEKRRQPKKLATVDLEALRERIAATIERAAESDPATLRNRIAELEKELKGRDVNYVTRTIEVPVPVFPPEQIEALERLVREAADFGRRMVETMDQATSEIVTLRASVEDYPPPSLPVPARANPVHVPPGFALLHTSEPSTPSPVPIGAEAKNQGGGRRAGHPDVEFEQLRAGERRMVETLARYYPRPLNRIQLATLSRFTVTGGTFGQYLSTIKRQGFVHEEDGELLPTEKALAAVPGSQQPLSADELREMWRGELRAGERALLNTLMQAYPSALSRDVLSEHTGYAVTGGTFGQYLSKLRRNGLVEVDGSSVRASDVLFLGGRE